MPEQQPKFETRPGPDVPNLQTGRLYGGLSTVERDGQRRAAVLEAGLELFGTRGYGPSSMTEIAERAGVPFRYLSRLFADKAALLEALFCDLHADVFKAVVEARAAAAGELRAQIRAGLTAALLTFTRDPRRLRIACLEVVGVSVHFEQLRRRTARQFVDLLVHGLDSAAEAGAALPENYPLLGVGLVGAIDALLTDWAIAPLEPRPALDELLEAGCLIYLRTLGLPA